MIPSTLTGVMFIGAHPDDETVMAGGMLALASARGIPTHVVCATDGRGGEYGEILEGATPDALAGIRAQELRCALDALGVSSLTLLGYEDPVIGPEDELYGFPADDATVRQQIADAIRASDANVILTHGSGGEYGHPAHKQVHAAVLDAVRTHALDVAVYGIAAAVPGHDDRLWNADDPAHAALDITPWAEHKVAAMECHRTQHVLFKRRRKLKTVREALRSLESVHRFIPAPATNPTDNGTADDAFIRLLVDSGGWIPGSTP